MSQSPLLERFRRLVPVERFESAYAEDISGENYFGFPLEPIVRAEERLYKGNERPIGYFSMEYGLSANTYNSFSSVRGYAEENLSSGHRAFSNLRAIDYYVAIDAEHALDLPIYSGGLGVLAGDTLKSAADRAVPLVAVGILWKKGYFKQNFWFKNGQIPEETVWNPNRYPGLVPLDMSVELQLKREKIKLKLWKYFVFGHDRKNVVPLLLLDSDVDGNSDAARQATGQLYKSDNAEWKILQRAILGLGGMKALDKCGYAITTYHMNEGHAALAFVERAKNHTELEFETLRRQFAYTCHTPVAAGHDRFTKKNVQELLGDEDANLLKKYGEDSHNKDLVNLTELSMRVAAHVNAVAQKHGEVTRRQFPQFADHVEAITNGVHAHTWISGPVAHALDKQGILSGWRSDPTVLSRALELRGSEEFRRSLWEAHVSNKKRLCQILKPWKMDPSVFTICWARRIAAYKRPSLILQDVNRLIDLAKRVGPIQVLFAGKAHPKDDLGFTFINEMLAAIDSLQKDSKLVRVMMLENYDTFFGKLLASSVDVWLNNPLPPFEASGTSGMKAILNGVLQMSTLDGWVVEAAQSNIGWIFGWEHHSEEIGDEHELRFKEDSERLYEMLEKVMKLYYETDKKEGAVLSSDWITKMVHCIASAGFFNTDRMVAEYQQKIWEGTPVAAK